ncbi:MAG TPA: hypothetical protein PLP50_02970 [Thermoanaerobaculia bacterium]|nr:hypothetical protein [Thermoanaerobaculia bacterium]HQN08486.1 hypothetical protein [Thermoanaerobaculia bacterium]HQP84637.1 hypothetical protein [Thermoanaerobaculia bacterium]
MRRAVLSAGFALALLAPLALASRPARADALADLRGALDRAPAGETVRVRVAIARTDVEKEKPKGERKGEAVVEHGPTGLSIHLDPAFLPKPGSKAERKKHDEKIVRLEPGEALKLVDPATELRQLLDGASVVSDRPETFEGKSARTVVFRVVPDLDDEARKAVKRYDDVVTLRLDADGLPSSLERTLDLKAKKLLISFTVSMRESRRFTRVAGRLVTASAREESHSSGLGQESASTTRWTVTPL